VAKQTAVGHPVYVCMIMDLINARRTYFTHFAIAGLTYSQLKNKIKILTPPFHYKSIFLVNELVTKGQLILICFLPKKRTKTSRQIVKTNLFVRFLEETSA